MSSLFILNETLTNGYRVEILDFISLAAILCGIFVIISKNPIVSVLFLIGLFLSISGYLIMLGINFIGLSYLLVYVGAVSILFLFILMLINVRISELLSDTSNSIPLAIIIGILFNYSVYQILPYSVAAFNSYTVNLKDI
jgi:NADH-ubiquinone oxidoreductase chain 6